MFHVVVLFLMVADVTSTAGVDAAAPQVEWVTPIDELPPPADDRSVVEGLVVEGMIETAEPMPTPNLDGIAGGNGFSIGSSVSHWPADLACDNGLCGSPNCPDAFNGTCGQSVASHGTPLSNLSRLIHRFDPLGLRDTVPAFPNPIGDRGIGYERVMFAPNVIDTAIGNRSLTIRSQIDRGLATPDRLEFFWAAGPEGPGYDRRVDVQDTAVALHLGNEQAMAFTEYTLRSLDPTEAGNTTGFGDLTLGAKATLINRGRLALSTVFRTYLPTGPVDRGLGRGTTSIEPGLLLRYCVSPKTYYFGEVKYWHPVSGTSDIVGDVLLAGWGLSTIAAETDVFALLPTIEMRTVSFLFGGETTSAGAIRRIDGETALEIYPGARMVFGSGGDMGLWELGFAGGVTVADQDWFDTRFVLNLRCLF